MYCTINMNTKVNLAHVAVFKNSLVSSVGGVMSSAVVQRASSGESNARLESVSLNQVTGTILNHLDNIDHGHAGLDSAASVLTDLTMDLSCPTDFVVLIKLFSLQCALLLVGRSPQVPTGTGM